MRLKVLGWVLVVASAFFAVVGAAPFGGGVFFPVISLPMAAVVAWRGSVVAPLVVIGLAGLGIWISVIPWGEILVEWGFVAWMAVWSSVTVAGLFSRDSG